MRFLCVLAVLISVCVAFRIQSVAVNGKLMCGSEPATGVLVKLIDQDAGSGPDPDDFIAQNKTGATGDFTVAGFTDELSIIDPEIQILHDCGDRGRPCQRRWKIRVPSKYINEGREPSNTMYLGTLNLEVELENESKASLCPLAFAAGARRSSGVQSYKVIGKFLCGTKPAGEVEVKLVDDDFGPDQDDVMASQFTDAEGKFELSGNTKELTTIDVHLKIYHDCNDGLTPCQRRWKFELPNSYISRGADASKVMDIGTWNLEALLPGESRDCQH